MVIPIHDDNPTRRPAVVTYLLVAVNVAVFLASPAAFAALRPATVQSVCARAAYFPHYGAIPAEVVEGADPARVERPARYELDGQVRTCPRDARPKNALLSVLTAMFVHGGWLHLIGNMLFLLVFGNNVEDRYGRLRFLGVYLGIGAVATVGFAALDPASTQPLVGASGAIAGVLGAYLVLFPRAPVVSLVPFLFFLPFRLPAWLVLGGWFVLQYVYFRGAGLSAGAGVAYGAHVIGFLAGLVLTLVLQPGAGRRPPPRRARAGWA